MKNINDKLSHCTGTENYYKTLNPLIFITDGVKEGCDIGQCHWFLDIVVTQNMRDSIRTEPFQTWKLFRKGKDGDKAFIEATDGDENVIFKQTIPYTDFEYDEFVIWVTQGYAILPSEY
jgi:hypothetical protein